MNSKPTLAELQILNDAGSFHVTHYAAGPKRTDPLYVLNIRQEMALDVHPNQSRRIPQLTLPPSYSQPSHITWTPIPATLPANPFIGRAERCRQS